MLVAAPPHPPPVSRQLLARVTPGKGIRRSSDEFRILGLVARRERDPRGCDSNREPREVTRAQVKSPKCAAGCCVKAIWANAACKGVIRHARSRRAQ